MSAIWYNTGIKRWFSVQYRLGTAHHYLHTLNTSAYAGFSLPKTPADHIPFASVLKTNIHDIIFGFLPVRLHSVGVIP
jgi:hypothetical protein